MQLLTNSVGIQAAQELQGVLIACGDRLGWRVITQPLHLIGGQIVLARTP
jgi:hypothetical protein